MFKFLRGRGKAKVVQETQRQTVERALGEVNEILAGLSDGLKISIDTATRLIEVDLPEQMPDEALALPAPAEEEKPATEPEPETAEDKKTEAAS